MKGKPAGLHYIRTKDGAEIDFCITNNNKPELLIETKLSDSWPARALINFTGKLGIVGIQTVLHLKTERMDKGVAVRRARNYLESLLL